MHIHTSERHIIQSVWVGWGVWYSDWHTPKSNKRCPSVVLVPPPVLWIIIVVRLYVQNVCPRMETLFSLLSSLEATHATAMLLCMAVALCIRWDIFGKFFFLRRIHTRHWTILCKNEQYFHTLFGPRNSDGMLMMLCTHEGYKNPYHTFGDATEEDWELSGKWKFLASDFRVDRRITQN